MFISNKVRIIGIIVGILALAGLVGVMVLTVQRAQQLQSTITRPKAAGTVGTWEPWPECINSSQNTYKCSDIDSSPNAHQCTLTDVTKCCASLGAGGSIYNCTWPARGWCTPAQCDAATPDNSAPPGSKKGRCGLYYGNSPACTAPLPTGKAVSPSPVNGEQNVSLKPTLTWSINDQGTNGAYVNVYLWSCAAKTDDCMVFGSATQTKVSIKVTSFYKDNGKGTNFQAGSWGGNGNPNYYVGSLKPNTQYWWVVTPGVTGGVQTYGDTWAFTTGAAPSSSCNVTLVKNSITSSEPVTAIVTGSGTNVVSSVYLWISKQVAATNQNSTAKITPTPVTTPALDADPNDYNYDPTHSLGGGDIFQYPVNVCNVANSSCNGQVTINSLPAGKYNISCAVGLDALPGSGSCSGNPLCSYEGGALNCLVGGREWKSCSSNDNTVLTVASETVCSAGQTSCGGACKNLQTDTANCGACGNTCTSAQTCTAGVCTTTTTTCTTGQTACGNVCKNLQTDSSNCGACGNACATGQTCTNGGCVTSTVTCTTDAQCSTGQVCAENSCVATSQQRIVCVVNKTGTGACERRKGTGNNAPGCDVTGKTCTMSCTTDNDCLIPELVCSNKVCVTKSDETNTCWGNLGTGTNAGRCYDCNGDGVINILDFSCFAKRWREQVQ